MSQTLNITDMDELKDIVAKNVAADSLEGQVNALKSENEELRKRLSNVEQTHVNQLLAYVGTDANGKIPPPPPRHDDAAGEEDESDASSMSGDGADGDNEDEEEDNDEDNVET